MRCTSVDYCSSFRDDSWSIHSQASIIEIYCRLFRHSTILRILCFSSEAMRLGIGKICHHLRWFLDLISDHRHGAKLVDTSLVLKSIGTFAVWSANTWDWKSSQSCWIINTRNISDVARKPWDSGCCAMENLWLIFPRTFFVLFPTFVRNSLSCWTPLVQSSVSYCAEWIHLDSLEVYHS